VIFKADNVLATGNGTGTVASAHMMAGPQAHLAKIAFERIFIGSRKRGTLVL
jgi:hypothetical protein